ncbi:MAG TPA: DUF1203 domain-containing protein [Pyrinomonadaceae bacterium]
MEYKVVAIPETISSEVRQTLVSPQYKSLAANVSVANGYGPCRSCLRVFDQGTDRRIYLTYNSFEGRSPLPDPGPIFIHENECERFAANDFPPDILELPVYLEAFAAESNLVTRVRMDKESVSGQISELFANESVEFINLRNAEVGCFIGRVERTQNPAD